jgi:arylsulfatase
MYKHYIHEGGIASPLIAHWPAKIAPRPGPKGWINTPAHLVDLMATFVDLSGATYPETFGGKKILPMEGQSLRPLLTGEGEFAPRPLFWEHENHAAIRIGDRKLVRLAKREWELFDMKKDRTEQHNLAQSNPKEVEALTKQWNEWARRAQVLPRPGKKGEKVPAKGKAKNRNGQKMPKPASKAKPEETATKEGTS